MFLFAMLFCAIIGGGLQHQLNQHIEERKSELETVIKNQDYEQAEKIINKYFYDDKFEWYQKIEQNKKDNMSKKELLLNYPEEFIKLKIEITSFSQKKSGKLVEYYDLENISYINTSNYNVRVSCIITEKITRSSIVKKSFSTDFELAANHKDEAVGSTLSNDSVLIDYRYGSGSEYMIKEMYVEIIE